LTNLLGYSALHLQDFVWPPEHPARLGQGLGTIRHILDSFGDKVS